MPTSKPQLSCRMQGETSKKQQVSEQTVDAVKLKKPNAQNNQANKNKHRSKLAANKQANEPTSKHTSMQYKPAYKYATS